MWVRVAGSFTSARIDDAVLVPDREGPIPGSLLRHVCQVDSPLLRRTQMARKESEREAAGAGMVTDSGRKCGGMEEG